MMFDAYTSFMTPDLIHSLQQPNVSSTRKYNPISQMGEMLVWLLVVVSQFLKMRFKASSAISCTTITVMGIFTKLDVTNTTNWCSRGNLPIYRWWLTHKKRGSVNSWELSWAKTTLPYLNSQVHVINVWLGNIASVSKRITQSSDNLPRNGCGMGVKIVY